MSKNSQKYKSSNVIINGNFQLSESSSSDSSTLEKEDCQVSDFCDNSTTNDDFSLSGCFKRKTFEPDVHSIDSDNESNTSCEVRSITSNSSNSSVTSASSFNKRRSRDKKERKKNAGVWKYFEKTEVPNVHICTLCKERKSSNGNTTNMWHHLQRVHKAEYNSLTS